MSIIIKPVSLAAIVCLSAVSLSAMSEQQGMTDIQREIIAEKSKMPTDDSIKEKTAELLPEIKEVLKVKPAEPTKLPENGYGKQVINVTPQDPIKEKKAVRDVMAAIQQLQPKSAREQEVPVAGEQEELLVFLSFSMPESMIKQYIEQAAIYKARVVFRGTVSGDLKMSENQKLIYDMKPRRMASVEINPTLFVRYAVTKVPTFAVGKYGQMPGYTKEGCLPPANFATISGDISIPYALKEIQKSGPADIKLAATRYLNETL